MDWGHRTGETGSEQSSFAVKESTEVGQELERTSCEAEDVSLKVRTSLVFIC